MSLPALGDRRRVAVLDGAGRLELSLAPDVMVLDGVARQGLVLRPGDQALVGRDGMPIAADLRAADLRDGAVLTVVDLRSSRSRDAGPAAGDRPDGPLAAWWALGAAGVLVAVIALGLPDVLAPTLRPVVAGVAAAAAFGAATAWAVRTTDARRPGVSPLAACLALAFAAGAAAVPPMAAGTALAVCSGLGLAAVLGALLSVVSRAGVVRAQSSTAAVILLALVLVWGGALLLGLPVQAPAAVVLGAAPVALRALPTTLLDVPPGMLLEYRRFQTSRWAVRETVPAEAQPLDAASAAGLVARSTGRLFSGVALLSLVAAVSAPFALPAFDAADPVVLGGRIALAATAFLALLLGSRRSTSAVIRWMPRVAALAVAASTLAALIPVWPSAALLLAAGALLALGIAVAFAVVPVARGSRSLFWSRMGDRAESLAVALSLPAGLVAAGVIDLLRGWMGS